MTQNQYSKYKQVFFSIRKQYPQQLTSLQSKISILTSWISQSTLTDFLIIYQNFKSQFTSCLSPQPNQKALDSRDFDNKDNNLDKQDFDKVIEEAINIIVQTYEKNSSIKQKYDFQDILQITQKTKITFKELLSLKKKHRNNLDGQIEAQKYLSNIDKNHKNVEKSIQQKRHIQSQPQSYIVSIDNNHTALIPEFQEPHKKNISNQLFIPKQLHISEQNIFKGQNQLSQQIQNFGNHQQKNKICQKPISSAQPNQSYPNKMTSQRKEKIQYKNQNLYESKFQFHDDNKYNDSGILNNKQNQQLSQSQNQLSAKNFNHSHNLEQQTNAQQEQVQQFKDKKQTQKKRFDQRENPFHLPFFKLSTQRQIRKKNPVQSILTNPYIKKTFNHLCKQNYIGGGKTFDQISQSADIMTLNKWMVFCKQFDFISKLKKKQLVDIFQQCTQNRPQMNQKQFLVGLIIVQSKMKVDEEDFIRKSMGLDSQLAFREKVATFKANYAGPKKNFFQESSIKPLDKYYQNLKQEKYQKQRQKQKQLILHQGKFSHDIQNELMQRKKHWNLKKSRLVNSSLAQKSQFKQRTSIDSQTQSGSVKSPYLRFAENNKANHNQNYSSAKNHHELAMSKLKLSRRIESLTYSQLLLQKNSISARAFTNQKFVFDQDTQQSQRNLTRHQKLNIPPKITQLQKIDCLDSKAQFKLQKQNAEKKQDEKSQIKATIQKPQKAQDHKPQRQWVQQIKNWALEFDKSQSEQSDDILRQHLMNEKAKKRDLPQKMELSRIVEEFKKDDKWLQPNEPDEHSEWQRETQLQTTKNKQRFK